jgi:peptidoglycan LD-endopeptidase CwlK
MTFKLSQRSLGNLEGVDKRLQKAVHHAIGETKVDFGVICGLRTIEEQRELVAKGASQTLKSKHLDGEAVDLMAYIGGGRASWELNLYDDIADAMREGRRACQRADPLGCRLAHQRHPRLERHDGRGDERIHRPASSARASALY